MTVTHTVWCQKHLRFSSDTEPTARYGQQST